MNENEKELSSLVTNSYYTLGNPTAKTLLYVLHGYGQLARYFIKKFQNLANTHFIVAPQGQHKFYLEGTEGRVGASWMTKENRQQDIDNYISYLNNVYIEITQSNEYEKVIILGFSQGVATACRWIEMTDFKVSSFLMCSGSIPNDFTEKGFEQLRGILLYYISGNTDPYKTEELTKEMKERFSSQKLIVSFTEFTGGHQIDVESINKILLDTPKDETTIHTINENILELLIAQMEKETALFGNSIIFSSKNSTKLIEELATFLKQLDQRNQLQSFLYRVDLELDTSKIDTSSLALSLWDRVLKKVITREHFRIENK